MTSSQMVTRKFKHLGLVPPPKQLNHPQWHALTIILKMTWAMALVPAEKFEDAINAIEVEAGAIATEHENIIIFIEYLRRQWLPIAKKVSVYDSTSLQNALTEAMNGQLFRALGGTRPGLLVFLGIILYKYNFEPKKCNFFFAGKIRELMMNVQLKYNRAINNELLLSDIPARQNIHNRQITKAQITLLVNR